MKQSLLFLSGMIKSYKPVLIHLMICISCLMVPLVFEGPRIYDFPNIHYNMRDKVTMLMYSLMLLFWYTNYYYLIPKFYLTKKYTSYILFLIVIICVILILDYYVDHSFFMKDHFERRGDGHHHKPMFHRPPHFPHFSQLLFLYIIGVFVSLYFRIKRNLDIIEIEKNHAEISYLKSQINPHFLFNTFNSIYALALKEHAERTADGMLKLSGMMRYVVSEATTDFVLLEKEIDYINNYIELQKLRLDKSVKLNYTLTGSLDEKRIPPLLLIPFIENAFKHGVNPDEDSEINIRIDVLDNELQLKVVNNKVSIHITNEKMGYGIENTKNRLMRIYPDMSELEIEETDKQYKVNLKLTLL